MMKIRKAGFNTQPPKGGWPNQYALNGFHTVVSTHSRLKAAGHHQQRLPKPKNRFNTQPPKGGWCFRLCRLLCFAGFNTQPPKGGWLYPSKRTYHIAGFNTQPPKGGWARAGVVVQFIDLFQHTAA